MQAPAATNLDDPVTCLKMSVMRKISVAITPCPNDIFMFHEMLAGKLALSGYELDFVIKDVESLNECAASGENDVSKMSFAAYLRVSKEYQMLGAGAALGFGCGPIILKRGGASPRPFAECRIAVPGDLTTAKLLFSLYAGGAGVMVDMPYDRIMDSVESGQADYGVVIHEGRFVYAERGFELVADLGEWWEKETGLPLPLGCIAARKTLGAGFADKFSQLLKESIIRTRANPEAALPMMREYAQEMDANVLDQHVSAYVNEFSLELGESGREAMLLMERRAREAGLIQ